MIPAFLKQLFYVAAKQSYAYIARITAIPYRTVLAMRTGKIEVSTESKRSLRNLYQRESYGRLRESGFSTTEARRWSWYRPEVSVLKEYSLKAKIAELATGAVASKLRALGMPSTPGAIDSMFDEMYQAVKTGIQRSERTTEEIQDY